MQKYSAIKSIKCVVMGLLIERFSHFISYVCRFDSVCGRVTSGAFFSLHTSMREIIFFRMGMNVYRKKHREKRWIDRFAHATKIIE